MIHRRHFLASLGASLVAAPFASLLARRASAAPPAGADRLIIVYTPNGTVPRAWRPTGSGNSFRFAPGSILEPLDARRQGLIVCDGIDIVGMFDHEYGMAALLTGSGSAGQVGGGASVDQFIGSRIGGDTRLRTLELGVQSSVEGGNARSRMCYAAPRVFVTPEDDPRAAWSRLFGDLVGGQDKAQRLLARRRSMLDLARGEIADLRARVGAAERAKLDQHLDALRATEQSLGTPTMACDVPPAPEAGAIYDNDRYAAIGRAQTDLLVSALACGATRVATLQWSAARGGPLLAFAPVSAHAGYHTLSHSDDSDVTSVEEFIRGQRWFASQFDYLLARLEATPDPLRGGSLLDSSLVMWASELGDARLHNCRSIPIVLAGGANGHLRLGQYLDFGGVPHQQLLVSLCRAMGLDVDRYGDDGKGKGPLPGVAS